MVIKCVINLNLRYRKNFNQKSVLMMKLNQLPCITVQKRRIEKVTVVLFYMFIIPSINFITEFIEADSAMR